MASLASVKLSGPVRHSSSKSNRVVARNVRCAFLHKAWTYWTSRTAETLPGATDDVEWPSQAHAHHHKPAQPPSLPFCFSVVGAPFFIALAVTLVYKDIDAPVLEAKAQTVPPEAAALAAPATNVQGQVQLRF
ncbi:hypothetical protein GPECTOR_34g739 [Gonium pectorale]|uniref:Uncharacterized protein n=1 Tax=Gonium pectorale TaxID=33097 RepID=A0A150GE02_GONPE|nr:hypothetical protein GPECTOR_34g739 [Gonium pectorale]|eukprot:KXZ47580.1 hypothetical protein GPECTOR_34g739 [Gonium pectorale]